MYKLDGNIKASSIDLKIEKICPGCYAKTSFESVGIPDLCLDEDYEYDTYHYFGQRKCSVCQTHIFFVLKRFFDQEEEHPLSGKMYRKHCDTILNIYPIPVPQVTITDLPEKILNSYKEALICFHNNCYIASAIMIRKTLEEICDDKQVAVKGLDNKIKALKEKLPLDLDLYQALIVLKCLGNDAAHTELKDFNKVGKEELNLGIKVVEEILNFLYKFKNDINNIQELKKVKDIDNK